MSLTITGVIVTVLVMLSSQLGLPFTEAELSTTVTVLFGLVGAGMSYWGRIRKGDIDWFGRRV
jgi:hypothetical protein